MRCGIITGTARTAPAKGLPMEVDVAGCRRTWGLEVHHIKRDGGNGFSNARVICEQCDAQTGSYGILRREPADFDEDTRERARARAGGRCECVGCKACLRDGQESIRR